jgi:hypothetical protein
MDQNGLLAGMNTLLIYLTLPTTDKIAASLFPLPSIKAKETPVPG